MVTPGGGVEEHERRRPRRGIGASPPNLRLVLTVVAISLAPAVLYGLLLRAGEAPLQAYGVQHLPRFHDLRSLTVATDCARRGIDPYLRSGCNQSAALLDYPRAWVVIFRLAGVHERDTTAVAGIEVLIFSLSIALLVRRAPRLPGLWLAVVCSPAVLFAIDRGNNDLVIFGLVAAAALGLSIMPGALALWCAAVLLKLFPVVAAPAFCRSRRLTLATAASLAAFCVYLVVTLHDVSQISHNVLRGGADAYGAGLLLVQVRGGVGLLYGTASTGQIMLGRSLAVGVAVVAWAASRHRPSLPPSRCPELFMAGSLIYAGSFALDISWKYRLIFLLLCLPEVIDAWSEGLLPKVIGGLIVAATWVGSPEVLRTLSLAGPLEAGATWALFAALTSAWARGWFVAPVRTRADSGAASS